MRSAGLLASLAAQQGCSSSATRAVADALCAAAASFSAAGASTSSSSSSSSSGSSGSSSSIRCLQTTSRGTPGQQQPTATSSSAAPLLAAAGPGPGSLRLLLQSADPSLPPRHTWRNLHPAAAYRPPSKAKQGKGGKGSKGGGGGAGAAAADDDGSGSFQDDAEQSTDAVRVALQAIDNVTPHLDVRAIRTHTKTTYVPGVMPPQKARSLALHWIIAAAEARNKASKGAFAECLALELLLAYQKRGTARQKRDDLHKLALQNRANLHLRWW